MGQVEERDVERTFFSNGSFFVFDFKMTFCFSFGGGRWGHQTLERSPVTLVEIASLLHMNNCRIHVVYVHLLSVRLFSLIG